MENRPMSFLSMVGFGLIALGLVRMALIVLHVPLFAYGDHSADVPYRIIGVAYIAIFGAMALATAWTIRAAPVASLAHGVLFFLLLADPAATLWFDTLEIEPLLLAAAYGIVAGSLIVVSTGGRRWAWFLLAAALAVLGFVREAFGFLPLVLAGIAAPALLQRSRSGAWAMMGVAVLVAIVQLVLAVTDLGVDLSTGATQPYRGAPEPAAAEEESPMLAEPAAIFRRMSKMLPATEALVPGYLYIASEGKVRTVPDLPPYEMSFLAFIGRTPALAYTAVLMGLLISAPFALAWLLWSARRVPPGQLALPLAYTLLLAIAWYSLAAIALTDDVAFAERRHHLGSIAALSALALVPFIANYAWIDLVRVRVALVAAIAVFILAACWTAWTYTRPMAIGVVDRMEEGSDRTLTVTGWALDPWGIRRVYAVVGGGVPADAARGVPRRDLEGIYPGYPDASNAGFEITIPSSKWRKNELMRLYVENSGGAVTEIDRKVVSPTEESASR